VTPQGGHDQPARTEPRFGRCHDSHHSAGGLPAAAIVEERTFRWRRVGSRPCDYIHAPLPRRELLAAFLTRRSCSLECERDGMAASIITGQPCDASRMRNGCRLRLAPVSFRGIVLASQAPGSAARLTQVPRRVRFLKVELKLPLLGGNTCRDVEQHAASPASAPWRNAVATPMVALPSGVPRGLLARPMWVVGSDSADPRLRTGMIRRRK